MIGWQVIFGKIDNSGSYREGDKVQKLADKNREILAKMGWLSLSFCIQFSFFVSQWLHNYK